MTDVDDPELWISSEEDGDDFEEDIPSTENATFFTLGLKPESQSGGFHVRNRPGETNRLVATQFQAGPKKRPAFSVGTVAKVIVHGTLDQVSNTPASLLVYDFSFFSYRSTRIKDATISFEFQAKEGSSSTGLKVMKVAPWGRHVMMRTQETVTRTTAADGGISGGIGINANVNLHTEKSVQKTTTHAAEVTGNNPCDEWSNCYLAQWSLGENNPQRSGIVTRFRACILLTRETDEEFALFPTVKVTPDLKTKIRTLVAFRRGDDPVRLTPTSDPIDDLGGSVMCDRWNLSAVDLDKLWDCTFYSTFEEAVKASKPQVVSEKTDETTVTMVEEAKVTTPL